MKILVVLLLLSVASASQWAVLVAGSSGYANYRHQADICHTYHLLLATGIPAEHIIVFSYNDVANQTTNPFPGQLFNAPGDHPTNVYTGCVVDYQGNDNNSTNFLAVLSGDAEAVKGVGSGRVLNTDIFDSVFVSFVDHGAPGLVSFPNDVLYADTLISTLQSMKHDWKFRHLLFFLDACDSGSMFDKLLPSDISVYAITAASDQQFSWGTFCPSDDVVEGTPLYTCLGDLFTVSWMDIVSRTAPSKLTLADLFSQVSVLTNQSTPMQFGDLSLSGESVSSFFGSKSVPTPSSWPSDPSGIGWKNRDATYQYLSQRYLQEPTTYNAYMLMDEIASRAEVTAIFSELMNELSPMSPEHLYDESLPVRNFACLRRAVAAYQESCGGLTDFAMGFVNVLKNACEEGFAADVIEEAVSDICGGKIEVKARKLQQEIDQDDYDDQNDDHDDDDAFEAWLENDFFEEKETSLSFWDWIIGL